jgi:hypothetical protein
MSNTQNENFINTGITTENFGDAGNFNFMPEVYSKKVQNFFRKSSVAEAVTNTDYAGEIASYGDTVRIIKEPVITVSDFARHGDGVTADHTIGSDNATDITNLDTDTGNIDLGFGNDEVDPLTILARMARLLDEANVPEEGRFVVASPEFYEVLSDVGSKLLNVDFNAGQGSIRNGLVSSGKLRGFEMYKSNNLPSQDNAAGVVLAGHVSATATAQTIINTEVIRDTASFGDIVRGLHVYGASVLRQEAIVTAHYGIDA